MEKQLLEQISDRATAEAVPLEVLFEVTHRCNLPCHHCYLPDHLDHGELSLEEIARLFDELRAAGTLFLTLTGGEVLARRDFGAIVDLAWERGFALKILTNATLITDEIAAHWARRNVLQVSVSVYGGSAEVHDAVTGIPGAFEKTRAGIDRLVAAGLQVMLKTPVMTLNGEAARGVHALAQAVNMPCQFELAISGKTNGDPGPLALQLQRRTLEDLLAQAPFTEQFGGPFDGPGPGPCAAGKAFASVGPTGDVLACIMMPTEVLGSVRARPFAAIWRDAPFLARLRGIGFEDLATCRACEVKGACGRCPGLAMQRGQGPDGCDLTAREVAKAKVGAATSTALRSSQLTVVNG